MNKKVTTIICMLMISICINVFFVEKTNATGTTIYVDDSGGQDYTSIQNAIDNASSGDTIYVYSGTYNENINIDKAITLTGQNRDNTIIDGSANPIYDCIQVNSNNVEISGFTIKNTDDNGIYLYNYGSCSIINNKINGYDDVGIFLRGSNSNTINSNIISGGVYCVEFLDGSSSSILTENTFEDASNKGVYIMSTGCSNNEIYHNNFLGFVSLTSGGAKDVDGNNIWDKGFPTGGNYWNDCTKSDNYCGSGQDVSGSDGIIDSFYQGPYAGYAKDDNPFVNQNGWENPPPNAEAGGPYSSTEGASIDFDGSGSTDPDGSIVGYRWDWDYQDGSNPSWDTSWLSSSNTSHSYSTAGTYIIMLQVKDDDDFVNIDTATVTISKAENQPPIANVGGPYSGYIDVSLQLSGSGSTDSDGSIVGYRWDFENDGTWDTGWLSSSTTTHTYSSIDTYTVKFQVKDNDGDTDNDTATVTVTQNQPPQAAAGGPYKLIKGEDITLDGSGSADEDGYIVSYRWTIDGFTRNWQSSPKYNIEFGYYTYSKKSQVIISLEVKDNAGAIDNDTTKITFYDCLEEHLPVADADGPYKGYVNYTIQFDASGSNDTCGKIISYYWDFGDGNFSGLRAVKPKHIYRDIGVYNLSLRVEDNDGNYDYDNTTVNITELPPDKNPPSADANGPYVGNVNETITYDAFGSSDSDGTIVSYNWSFGDGTFGQGINPTHIYSSIGNFTVKLTVEDNDGLIDTNYTIAKISQPQAETDNNETNDTNSENNDNTQTDENTPGFEIVLMFMTIMIILFIKRKKQ